MFNTLLPPIFRRLRKLAGLSQTQAAVHLKVSRSKLCAVEKGRARLSPEQEAALVQLAGCSTEELTELFCEQLSAILGKRVAIEAGEGYQPSMALARARSAAARLGERLAVAEARALHSQIHTTQLIVLACERSNADLDERVSGCFARVGKSNAGTPKAADSKAADSKAGSD